MKIAHALGPHWVYVATLLRLRWRRCRIVDRRDHPSALADRVDALRGAALTSILERDRRIFQIGERLRTSCVDLCPEQRRPVWGIGTATEVERVRLHLSPYRSRQDAAQDVEILWVESGSPADRAGLLVGDVIVSADGRRVRKSNELYRRIGNGNRERLPVTFRRGDEEHEVSMPLVLGRFAAAGLWPTDAVNA